MRTRFGVIAFVVLFLTASLATAEVYQWEDERGGMHFTDNAEKIPVKYRQKVKQRESIKATESGQQPLPQAPQHVVPPPPVAGKKDDGELVSRWVGRINLVKQELAAAQNGLVDKKEALQRAHRAYVISLDNSRLKKDPDTVPSYALNTIGAKRKAYYDLQEEVAKAEAQVKEAEAKLATLRKEAAEAGVAAE